MNHRLLVRVCGLVGALAALTMGACQVPTTSLEPFPQASPSGIEERITTRPARADASIAQMANDIDFYVSNLTNGNLFAGVILVIYDGDIVIEKGYGLADIEHQLPNLPTTHFRISSLTKAFTAMAILQLQEHGRVHVEDYLCHYLTPCPEAWHPITLHQLLTHTSGIPDYVATPGYWNTIATRTVTPEALIALVADEPLLAAPGTQFAYSNSGYVLLGYVIAQVTDPTVPAEQAYRTYLQQHIFAPLGMRDTGSEACHSPVAPVAVGYLATRARAPACDSSTLFAMGELYSTVEDLYRWGQALGNDTLISSGSRAAMVHAHVDTIQNNIRQGYGYGWYVKEIAGVRRIWHSGATPGYRSYFQREIDRETMVILLSNDDGAPILTMGQEIAAVLIRRSTQRIPETSSYQP